ncbi:multiprotein-bridging factor 1 family protein [Streptomyces sp. NPDC048111]|uniref:helix-turn-helix domain-containing protein n=1 Tax=Streptomyces sp. NPDC048111 TaxID=3365500 RepID=UPI00371AD691
MNLHPAIDALLAAHTPLPAPCERARARNTLGISLEQLAHAIGTSTSALQAWEEGLAEPDGHPRDAYAHFLLRAYTVVDYRTRTATPTPAPDATLKAALCVLCGKPATDQVAGYPQHLTATECAQTNGPVQPAPTPATRRQEPAHSIPSARRPNPPPPARTGQDPIRDAVTAAMTTHDGDPQKATAALTANAIPDAMRLLNTLRVGGRYDIVHHPALPDMLRKPSPHTPDLIWEARLNWQRPTAPRQTGPVAILDMNGAYLSALKTHLPLGQLQPTRPQPHDARRAGVHLITPPVWEHDSHLPNPLGPRAESGPLWITEPTLRLLLRLSGPRHALCEPPVIHESYTSGSTENLLEKFRTTLRDARARALDEDDAVTLDYVKALYSKFVATLGESTYNRDLRRPDWMHIIRAQAFANLWSKAYKAHTAGLTLLRVCGTDELHLQGDWRQVLPEGRDLNQVKLKDTHHVAALYPQAQPQSQVPCTHPSADKRRYEYAGGRYIGCHTCGGDLCTSCWATHLTPSDTPFEYNDDNLCPACRQTA